MLTSGQVVGYSHNTSPHTGKEARPGADMWRPWVPSPARKKKKGNTVTHYQKEETKLPSEDESLNVQGKRGETQKSRSLNISMCMKLKNIPN
jgi:hypothetical protein